MYCLSDQQIEYILNDIRRNGIETEDLQSNLLDHICCMLEQNLKEEDDFENFYQMTVKQFYVHDLREIEEETIYLLNFKKNNTMKKVMLLSGFISVAAFAVGSVFKIMHWQGASFFLILALIDLAMIFIPLVGIIKTIDAKTKIEKAVCIAGTLLGILYISSTMFALQHWDGRTELWLATVAASIFVYLPLYLYKGFQHPETRYNTIVNSMLVVGISGSLFALINLS